MAVWPGKIQSGAWLFECNVVAIFVDFFHFCYFLLLFLLFVSFVSYFLLLKGVKFVTFLLLVTFINYFLLGQEGQGLYSIHCGMGGGKGVPWFFSFILLTVEGEGGGWKLMFFLFPSLETSVNLVHNAPVELPSSRCWFLFFFSSAVINAPRFISV